MHSSKKPSRRPTRRERSGQELFELLLKDVDGIAARIIADLRALPAYAAVPPEALHPGASGHVRAMLSAARDRRTRTSAEERRMFAQNGETRARQGIPVEDLLRGWRVGIDHAWNELKIAGERAGLSDTDLLADLQALLAFTDEAMIAASVGHRRAELHLAQQEHERRLRFVRAVLSGSLPPADLQMQAEAYGLDPFGRYHAVRAPQTDAFTPHHLERVLALPAAGPRAAGLTATIDGDIVGLAASPRVADAPVPIGIGPAAHLDSMEQSFGLATRTISTATAFGLTGVIHFADLGIRPAIVADRHITEQLVARYVEPLRRASSSQDTLLETIEVFMECGMSVARAADRLHVHPNTLRYRLARISELTGAKLEDPNATSELWWALQATKLSGGSSQRRG
jgi:hypothetical protein